MQTQVLGSEADRQQVQMLAKKAHEYRSVRLRNRHFKLATAASGPSPHRQVEESLATMGYTYLQDRVPSLIEYLKGFQVIDKNEDSSFVVGAFGFLVNKYRLLVPIFFVDGQLKGYQLLYVGNTDLMLPLSEAMVNYVVNQAPANLGEVAGNRASLPFAGPPNNMQRLTGMMLGKMASMRKFARDMNMLEDYARLRCNVQALKDAQLLKEGKSFDNILSPMDVAGWSRDSVMLAGKWADSCPAFNEHMIQKFGQDWPNKMVDTFRKKASESPRRAPASARLPLTDNSPKSIRKIAEVSEVYPFDKSPEMAAFGLSKVADDVVFEFYKYGAAIEDNRVADGLSDGVWLNKMRLESPTGCGVYEVLNENRDWEKCLVVPSAFNLTESGPKAMMINIAEKAAVRISPNETISNDQAEKEPTPAYDQWFKSLESTSVENMSEGSAYLVLSPERLVAGPFIVDEVSDKVAKVRCDGVTCIDVERGLAGDNHTTYANGCYSLTVIPTDSEIQKMYLSAGGTLVIPSACKIWKLSSKSRGSDGLNSGSVCVRSWKPTLLRDMSLSKIRKKANLNVEIRPAKQVIVNDRVLPLADAYRHLVFDYKLHKTAAQQILDQPIGVTNNYIVKIAAGDPTRPDQFATPSINFPQMMNPTSGPTISEPYMEEVPEVQEAIADTSMYGSVNTSGQDIMQPTPNTFDLFGGSKGGPGSPQNMMNKPDDAFKDLGALNAMLDARHVGTVLQAAQKQLLQSMDRVGKVIFSFFAHQEEFKQRYGESDMPTLEDSLLSLHEAQGENFTKLQTGDTAYDVRFDNAMLPLE